MKKGKCVFFAGLVFVLAIAVPIWAFNPDPLPTPVSPPSGGGCWDCLTEYYPQTGVTTWSCTTGTGGSKCEIEVNGGSGSCTISGECGTSSQ